MLPKMVEKLEPSHHLAAPQKTKHWITYDPAIPLTGISPGEMKTRPFKTCTQMFKETLCMLAPKWVQPKCTSAGKMTKKISHGGILFANKKEWNASTCYNMDELWTQYAKWKKPAPKDRIVHDSIYALCQEHEIYRDLKWINSCFGLGTGEPWKEMGSDC